jgi:hypothetical protein
METVVRSGLFSVSFTPVADAQGPSGQFLKREVVFEGNTKIVADRQMLEKPYRSAAEAGLSRFLLGQGAEVLDEVSRIDREERFVC